MSQPQSGETEFTDDITALYRLYDSAGALLYVGITCALRARLRQHAAEQPWWRDVARKTVEWFGSRDEADLAETAVIASEDPLHNVAKRRDATEGVASDREVAAGLADHEVTGRLPEALDWFRSEVEAATLGGGPGSWPVLAGSLEEALHFVCDLRKEARQRRLRITLPLCKECTGQGVTIHCKDAEYEGPDWFENWPCRACLTTGFVLDG